MKIRILFLLSFIYSAMGAQNLEPKGTIKDPVTFSEKSHNFFLSKRLKVATHQRDSLLLLTVEFNNDTAQRGIKYRYLDSQYFSLNKDFNELASQHQSLQNDYSEMNDKFTELIKSSLSKTEQLNLALREKGDQLMAREKRLSEVEALLKHQDSITNALNDIVKRALLSFNSDELTVEMKNGKVYVSMTDNLLFRSGSASVEEKGKEAIKKLAEVLNKNADVSIMIEGHTDNVPIKTAQFADNWDLSVARSTNIVRLLDETYRVDAKRLTAAGRGEYMPKASNETPEGRAKNRRTEIILSPKLDELYRLIQKK